MKMSNGIRKKIKKLTDIFQLNMILVSAFGNETGWEDNLSCRFTF